MPSSRGRDPLLHLPLLLLFAILLVTACDSEPTVPAVEADPSLLAANPHGGPGITLEGSDFSALDPPPSWPGPCWWSVQPPAVYTWWDVGWCEENHDISPWVEYEASLRPGSWRVGVGAVNHSGAFDEGLGDDPTAYPEFLVRAELGDQVATIRIAASDTEVNEGYVVFDVTEPGLHTLRLSWLNDWTRGERPDGGPILDANIKIVRVFFERAGPVRHRPAGNFASVATGILSSCGLDRTGKAFCWGSNYWGALGNPDVGEAMDFRSEAPVPVATSERYRALTAADNHVCGLTRDGRVLCWGKDNYGQLGFPAPDVCETDFGTGPCSAVPREVSGNIRFASVDAGWSETCGTTPSGEAYCWGVNHYGQLGTTTSEVCGPYARPCSTTPVRVDTDVRFASVSAAGIWHACGLDRQGNAYCWGRNVRTFGNGEVSLDPNPVPTPAAPGHRFAELHAGVVHNCGLERSGEAWCWGSYAFSGELGDGSGVDSAVPVPVAGGLHFASLAVPKENWVFGTTCGVTRSGEVWCWGSDEMGQLGAVAPDVCTWRSDSYDCALTPVPLEGGLRMSSVSVGRNHVCGTTPNGEAWCWGGDIAGQLGAPAPDVCDPWSEGGIPCAESPVRVQAPTSIVALARALSMTAGANEHGRAPSQPAGRRAPDFRIEPFGH